MEDASLISKSFFSSAKCAKILTSLGRGGSVHAHLDAPSGLAVDANVKVDRVGNVRSLLSKESRKETTDHLEFGAATRLLAGAGGGDDIRRANKRRGLGANGSESPRHLGANEDNSRKESGK